jgi:hypothetical protein
MERLWIRQYKVDIINPSKVGASNLTKDNVEEHVVRSISSVGQEDPLRVQFEVELGEREGKMTMAIYNLAESTISDIMIKDSFVRLSVGYGIGSEEEDLSQIFIGKITFADTVYETTSRKTIIEAEDGSLLKYIPINVRIPKENLTHLTSIQWYFDQIYTKTGQQINVDNAKEQLQEIADEAYPGENGIYLYSDLRGTRTFVGEAARTLDKLLKPHRIQWSVINGNLNLTREGYTNEKIQARVLKLGEELLTVPKRAVNKDNQLDPRNPVQFIHKIFIQPDIKPGSYIKTEELYDRNGQIVQEDIFQSVISVKISGDYEGNNWNMVLSCTDKRTFYNDRTTTSIKQNADALAAVGGS